MGISGIGGMQLLVILVIVVLVFGTKKLRNAGGDMGAAVRNFRSSMKDGKNEGESAAKKTQDQLGADASFSDPEAASTEESQKEPQDQNKG